MKKPKFLLFAMLFLVFTNIIQGQVKHELKISLTGLFNKDYMLSYERLITEDIGLELGLGSDRSNLFLYDFDLSGIERYEFDATQLNPSIGGKYYFLLNDGSGRGFFIGPYIRLNYLVNREEGYAERWGEINGVQPTERVLADKGFKSLYGGLNGGLKWRLKTSFVTEALMTGTLVKSIGKGEPASSSWIVLNFDSCIRIGYRF